MQASEEQTELERHSRYSDGRSRTARQERTMLSDLVYSTSSSVALLLCSIQTRGSRLLPNSQ